MQKKNWALFVGSFLRLALVFKTCLIRSATSDLLFVRHFPGVQLWGCLSSGFCVTNYHHCQAFIGRHQSGNLECKTNWNPTLDRARHAMSMVPVWANVVCPHPLTCIESEAQGLCACAICAYVTCKMPHRTCCGPEVIILRTQTWLLSFVSCVLCKNILSPAKTQTKTLYLKHSIRVNESPCILCGQSGSSECLKPTGWATATYWFSSPFEIKKMAICPFKCH